MISASAPDANMIHNSTHVLECQGLHKRFGAVVALNGASIAVRRGEVMALMGDNGAGKTTLIKSISGVVIPDSGRILLEGDTVKLDSPGDALELGIETVYQDLALIDSMSATDNIFLGRERIKQSLPLRALRVVDRRGMAAAAADAIAGIGARVPSLDADVAALSGGQRQALAIARAIIWGRRIVILDEPTAALGVQESGSVLDMIVTLKSKGMAVIMISHNIEHVFRIADRVTVMRQGRTAGVLTVGGGGNEQDVVALITGAVAEARPDFMP